MEKGSHHTDEVKKIIREKRANQIITDEHKNNLSMALKRAWAEGRKKAKYVKPLIKCEYCGTLTKNDRFCSKRCLGFVIGPYSGKIAGEVSRKLGTNVCFNPKLFGIGSSKAGKATQAKYSREEIKEWARRAGESCKRNKSGLFSLTVEQRRYYSNLGREASRKLKKGFFDPIVQANNGRKGAEATRKVNKYHVYDGITFDSRYEQEIAMCIKYQFNITLQNKINVHYNIGTKEVDFFIEDTIIECHPYVPLYDKEDKKLENYYKRRRELLDNNGFKEKELVVIS